MQNKKIKKTLCQIETLTLLLLEVRVLLPSLQEGILSWLFADVSVPEEQNTSKIRVVNKTV